MIDTNKAKLPATKRPEMMNLSCRLIDKKTAQLAIFDGPLLVRTFTVPVDKLRASLTGLLTYLENA